MSRNVSNTRSLAKSSCSISHCLLTDLLLSHLTLAVIALHETYIIHIVKKYDWLFFSEHINVIDSCKVDWFPSSKNFNIPKWIVASIFLLKVNIRNTTTRCEICSKLTIKTPKQHPLHFSGVFIVNFEHISHFVLVLLLLTLNMQLPAVFCLI